ncbi:MAG: 4-hydroxyphenylpyruvate dioxygenase [Chloroflexota bacterium]|jgi:4-hydroxyphenylpyruvate dioxygenase|nr:4-hydroxyphenylpyruvate dioxygenase [Chloroflexota bacterium]
MTETALQATGTGAPALLGTDHVELWVGNARQAAHYYRSAFGFDVIAYAGPETGVRDRASYVLQQGHIRLVLTAALGPEGAIAEHVRLHGDGVRTIALRVDDATAAFEAATSRGARPVEEPHRIEDASGAVRSAAVATFGDTVHRFIERDGYAGAHLPGYREDRRTTPGVGLRFIDHAVGNVEVGRMDPWVDWYHTVFNFDVFQEFDENDIATRYSALRSKVTRDPATMITFPINEPASGLRVSQIQEYLDYYRGPGVQHIALHTDDVVDTVRRMRDSGVEFLTAPAAYYESLTPRLAAHGVTEDLDHLRELGILVDFEEDGYLLQIFTRPVGDRPTLFYEVIQRRGARGFGKGNFKALFEAIEREQAARGNL